MGMIDLPYNQPDARGHFGPYGGVFVAETLVAALDELRSAYAAAREDAAFRAEFEFDLKHYVGRPSPVYHAKRWSRMLGGAQIYLKREDLNHTGAHKINNCIGQALLARRLGKRRRRDPGGRARQRRQQHRRPVRWPRHRCRAQ